MISLVDLPFCYLGRKILVCLMFPVVNLSISAAPSGFETFPLSTLFPTLFPPLSLSVPRGFWSLFCGVL